MKRIAHRALIAALALWLPACLPEERFWWSPAGDRAVVSIEEKLHLVSAEGVLGALPDGLSSKDALVKSVSWLPDGGGFACQRTRRIASWEEVRTLVPAEEVKAVDALMPAVLPLLEAAAKMAGEAATVEAVLKALPLHDARLFSLALRRTFQKDPAAVGRAVQALPKGSALLDALKADAAGYDLEEIVLVRLTGPSAAPVSLLRSVLRQAVLPRVSPKEAFIACVRLDEAAESIELHVLPLDGGAGMLVARKVSGAFDWTPDGRSLVFMAPIGGEGEKLQGIHRVRVIDDAGKLSEPGEPRTLATAVTLNRPALQVLADGRVLFASQPVTLPAAGAETELEPRLYLIAADGKSVQPVPTAPGDLPTNLACFVAAPDGSRIAVVESETDAVAVVETDSGKMQLISPPHPKWQNRTVPAWKSATELSFAALHEGRPAWMLWSETDNLRCLSASWPSASTAKWLIEDKERK
ncbi:MAG: hypothetical protein JNM65_03215 [Verrucomicrobiaceae bacterium]|nr:hypothetical protein [Verrucomicrobiaceae bacterium]